MRKQFTVENKEHVQSMQNNKMQNVVTLSEVDSSSKVAIAECRKKNVCNAFI